MEFQSRSIKSKLDQWKLLTFDPEVLEKVFGRPISIALEDLPPVKTCKYLFNKKETKSIEEDLDNLIKEKLIIKSKTEPWEFASPIFFQEKLECGFCLILNLKKLNKKTEYEKF